MSAILEVKNLTKNYGKSSAVSGVSFAIEPGEIVGFVGLNGAGKSTTITMLLGLQKPTSGSVFAFGKKVTTSTAHVSHYKIGYATGDMTIFDSMTGGEYLKFVAAANGIKLGGDSYVSLVERFEPQLNKKIKTLSRGNKQKIALIAAFMVEPELVILDEPSSGLDPVMQKKFLELIREESKKGVAILMSSHYVTEVVDVCTRILFIRDGKLTKDINTSDLDHKAGKLVTVVTKQEVSPPAGAKRVSRSGGESGEENYHNLSFTFAEPAIRLQEWLGSLPYLKDLSVKEHSPYEMLESFYAKDVGTDNDGGAGNEGEVGNE